MFIKEVFWIGDNPGQYPAGNFIQDSLFRDSRVVTIERNDTIGTDGYSVSEGKLYFDQALTNGEKITANLYKY